MSDLGHAQLTRGPDSGPHNRILPDLVSSSPYPSPVFLSSNRLNEIWGRDQVFSYRWRVVYLFSEGFRVQDIATILHVGCTYLKKLIKLYRETSTVNYPAERAAALKPPRFF